MSNKSLIENTIKALEHQAKCCGGQCERSINAKNLIEVWKQVHTED